MSTLADYIQRTQRLLTDQTFQRYNPFDLVEYINEGRKQVAGEAGCIHARGSLTTVVDQQVYLNSAIILPSNLGYDGVSFVERIWYVDDNTDLNPILLEGRPWGWFNLYFVTLGASAANIPKAWAQFTQGPTGSFYIAPIPPTVWNLQMDVAALPASMTPQTVSTDVDALPYPWTDAVPFYAAGLAYTGEKLWQEAGEMMAMYERYVGRAGRGVTPSEQPASFPTRSIVLSQPPTRAANQNQPS